MSRAPDPSAQLEWVDGQPLSRRFGDIYFSRASGIDETHHVFLRGNRLPHRFAALAGDSSFSIGETGFGTGLNFLCTWQLFECTAPAGARLHFVSTELYPLSCDEITTALGLWPELAPFSAALLAQYRALAPGWHRLLFAHGRVVLTLIVGDARATLSELEGGMDAWFLDGFSPARNPQMWAAELLHAVGSCSCPGATFATYTCAGVVRRGLERAGFRVEKAGGFGPKREMLRGEYAGAAGRSRRAPAERALLVVGGGLAGTAAAHSLAQRGWRVTLLERHTGLAAEASGNPQGVLYARLSPAGTPLSQLVLAGYQFTLRLLRRLMPCDGEAWSDAPVLQLAYDEHEASRHKRLQALELPATLMRAVDRDEASRIAGIPVAAGGLLFPDGGWVHPPALCRALAFEAGVAAHASSRVVSVRRAGSGWCVLGDDGVLAEAPALVLAVGPETTAFAQAAELLLRVNRGQITLLPATEPSNALAAVLCAESYVTPARAGQHSAGATFARETSVEARAADNAENLRMLSALSVGLYEALGAGGLDPAELTGRAALRCVSPDYLPVVGPLEDGLYVSTAHGSRGLITAPLAGEILAAQLEGEPAPLPRRLMEAVHPQRLRSARETRAGSVMRGRW